MLIRTVLASDRRAVARLFRSSERGDSHLTRRVHGIVDAVRKHGDRALLRFARQLDGVSPPLEVSREEMSVRASEVDPAIKKALKAAAGQIARVAFRQIPRHWDLEVGIGVSIEQRV